MLGQNHFKNSSRRKEKLSCDFSELSVLCALARETDLRFRKNCKYIWLVLSGNEPPALKGRLVVVSSLHRALRKLHPLALHLLVRNQTEQVTDTVEARPPFVVRGDDVPGRKLRVRGLKHYVARPRVLEPSAPRAKVRRAQLPLAQRVCDPGLEAALLLGLAHLEPVLDEMDAVIHEVQLELGAGLEEALVLLLRAEAHHVLDAGAVVPAAVENHDFACRRGVPEKTLHVDLGLLAVGRRRQRYHAEHAMADTVGDRLDDTALAGGIAPFEDHDYPRTRFLDPILQRAQLYLQLTQCLLVLLTLQALISSCHRFPFSSANHVPASTAVTALRRDADERMIIFSSSTTRKNARPPRKSRGQTQSGIASLSNSACSG